jgi:flagellar motor component MotA
MMFKGIAFVLLGVFLGLSVISGSSDSGFGFILLTAFTFAIGCGSVFFFALPAGFVQSVMAPIRGTLPSQPETLAAQIESIATVIRQDGLLALEGKRREIRNSELRSLLKRIMDGFESKDLIPLIENQRVRRGELLDEASRVLDRFSGYLTQVGLVQSLILISVILSQSQKSKDAIGVAQAFLPFLIALISQIVLDSFGSQFISEKRDECELYFSVLEAGIVGIQKGENPELVRDRIRARIDSKPTFKES